jgi:hypothetical protein
MGIRKMKPTEAIEQLREDQLSRVSFDCRDRDNKIATLSYLATLAG